MPDTSIEVANEEVSTSTGDLPSAEESLRLITTFLRVKSPKLRAEILAAAERYADQSR